jgi:hypothetical protein
MDDCLAEMKLPFELIRLIIHQTDHRPTLASWARVNWAARAEAESILWESVVVKREQYGQQDRYDCPEREDGISDPLLTLQEEATPENKLKMYLNTVPRDSYQDLSGFNDRPAFRKAAYVKRLSFEGSPPTGDRAESEFDCILVFQTFQILSPILVNLQSVWLEAEVTQECWDALISLPGLRQLSLFRTFYFAYDDLDYGGPFSGDMWELNFKGLSKLQEFVTGKLLKQDAFALGTAVRKSNLEKLHICANGFKGFPEIPYIQPLVLHRFIEGLTAPSRDRKFCTSLPEEQIGFPSTLVDLLIGSDDYP